MLTGEPLPVDKRQGDEVFGGTVNTTGSFMYDATAVGRDTALAQIVRLVEDAQGTKAPAQRLPETTEIAAAIARLNVPVFVPAHWIDHDLAAAWQLGAHGVIVPVSA
jgi:cation transport ATPase